MRFQRNPDDFVLDNEAEIEAALRDALSGPIDRLLAIEEFIEKTEPQPAEPVAPEPLDPEAEWFAEEDLNASTIAFPVRQPTNDESSGQSSRAA